MLPQIGEIGQDEIDAEMLVAGEGKAGVDDHEVVPDFVDHQVLSDLSEAAERRDLHCRHGRKLHLRAAEREITIPPSEAGSNRARSPSYDEPDPYREQGIRRRSSHCCGTNGFTGSACSREFWASPPPRSSGRKQRRHRPALRVTRPRADSIRSACGL